MNYLDNTEEEPKPKGLGQYAAEKLAEFEAAKPLTSTGPNWPVAPQTSGNGSVFDQLDEHADWYDDILGPKGWAEVKPGDSQTLRAFRRPGATYPISAKVLKANPHVLVNHSEDSGLPVGAGQKLTKARVLAHLHYGGDESALAKALIRGEVVGPRPHIAQLFKTEQTTHFTVTETSIEKITGEIADSTTEEEGWSRWANLKPYLDGTAKKPKADAGGERDDGIQVLYPKRWHTVIGLTGSAKTTFALWHVKAALDAGEHVVYLHFEEPEPDGVIERLRGFGINQKVIDKQFHWANCDKAWAAGEMAYRITQLEQSPVLAVLDGINAACSQHGWKVSDTEAIGSYRAMFVTPLVKAGAAVLSLGHPPKAKDRQNEMHGFGSTGWLDEVDGVGFRMVASKNAPMMAGAKGYSALYVVKDRYSQVKRWGNVDTTKEQPWFYMGAFIVDDSQIVGPTIVRLNVPENAVEGGPQKSKEAALADHIEECLQTRTVQLRLTEQPQGHAGRGQYQVHGQPCADSSRDAGESRAARLAPSHR